MVVLSDDRHTAGPRRAAEDPDWYRQPCSEIGSNKYRFSDNIPRHIISSSYLTKIESLLNNDEYSLHERQKTETKFLLTLGT